jgi:hypothetical protein
MDITPVNCMLGYFLRKRLARIVYTPQDIAAHRIITSPTNVFEAIEIPALEPVTMTTIPMKASPIPMDL